MPVSFAPQQVRPELSLARTSDTASGTAAAAVVTYPGVAGVAHALTEGVWYSYSGSGTLAGGRLTIADGSNIVADVDITAKGQGFFPFRRYISPGNALVVTLASGGADVTGKVTVPGYAALSAVGAGAQGQLDFSDWLQSGLLGVL